MVKPEIRLKGFEGEWERHSLEECLSISNERNANKKFGREDVLSVSDDFGVVNQIKFLGRSYAGADLSGYKVVRPGQVIYTKSPLRFKPFGIIKENQKENGIVSVLYAVYNTPKNLLSSFVDLFFTPSYRTNNYLLPLISKGAKNTINISDEDALKGTIYFPIVEEQKGITDYFISLDSMLQSTTKKIESLKQMKQASLVSMFPQAGETTPRVRFKGFEREWKFVKLGSLCEKITRKASVDTKAPVMMISASSGFINQSEKYSTDNAGQSLAKYTLLYKGEMAYNHGASKIRKYGSCFALDRKEARVPFVYHTFKLLKDDSYFFAYYLNSGIFDSELRKVVSSTARMDGLLNISYETYMNLNVYRPDYEEQKRIASYFRSLDNQISLQEKRLEKLKQIKAACLDKMFV